MESNDGRGRESSINPPAFLPTPKALTWPITTPTTQEHEERNRAEASGAAETRRPRCIDSHFAGEKNAATFRITLTFCWPHAVPLDSYLAKVTPVKVVVNFVAIIFFYFHGTLAEKVGSLLTQSGG